jgi:predicted nicotinamide N-methyase
VTPEEFVASQTVIARAPLVPEVALHLASEITPIWQATEAWLAEQNIEPPFWAFAWPGGQALARAAAAAGGRLKSAIPLRARPMRRRAWYDLPHRR